MGENSKIEWCDHTFNPWIGCTKVSPGCAHCYAEKSTRTRVLRKQGRETWGAGSLRERTSAAYWRGPLKWNAAPDWNFGIRKPRVFCASLADWLDDEVPIEWLADLLQLIRATPNLDWLLLTKRPQNWHDRMCAAMQFCERAWLNGETHIRTEVADWIGDWGGVARVPHNVRVGTTVEDQKRANERIPELLKIPTGGRFLSCEPLLEHVDLDETPVWFNNPDGSGGIDWVICGGESGPNARPMHPDWARALRDQCQAANVPFFFKQWGDYAPACAQYPQTEAEHDESEHAGGCA